MAQLLVRNLERDVKVRLKRRAQRHGQSMEAEARDILRNAVRDEDGAAARLGSRLRDRFSGMGLDADVTEIGGQKARTTRFSR